MVKKFDNIYPFNRFKSNPIYEQAMKRNFTVFIVHLWFDSPVGQEEDSLYTQYVPAGKLVGSSKRTPQMDPSYVNVSFFPKFRQLNPNALTPIFTEKVFLFSFLIHIIQYVIVHIIPAICSVRKQHIVMIDINGFLRCLVG